MIHMMHAHPRAERPGSVGRRVLCWKRAEFVVSFLTLMGIQSHWNVAIASRPKVSSVKDGGGEDASTDLGGVRSPGAPFQGPWTDRSKISSSGQQSGVEVGDNAGTESVPVKMLKAGLRSRQSSNDVYSASLLVQDSKPYTLVDGMERLKSVSHFLRSDKDLKYDSLLVEVRDVAKDLLRGLLFVQEHYEKGDKEGAAAALKTTVGDLEYLVKADRRMEAKRSIMGLEILESSSLDDAMLNDLEKVSNARLAEFLQPRVIDEQIEILRDAVNILQNLDISLLSSQVDRGSTHQNFDSDLDSTNNEHLQERFSQDTLKFELNTFDFGSPARTKFGQSRAQFGSQKLFDHSSLQNFMHQLKMARSSHQVYPQRLSKMSSLFQNDPGVMARHQLRMNALGDTCPSQCTDNECNCKRLFACVNKLSAYDLAVLVAGGFIDRSPTSQNYANFTVSVDDLSLFDADANIGEKLVRIQAKTEDLNDISQCTAVLEELYTGCDTSKVSCVNPNTESFRVSIDQICGAVNTKTKLLFEVIGDEFDGFVDKGVVAKPKPLSFDVCWEFVVAFDSLYEARDEGIYPLPNPMRKGSEALHNKETNEIFQYTQFPIFNWFNKDLHTGIVDRTFVGVTGDRFFTIVLPASEKMTFAATQTTKAISYDANCGEKVSLKTHNPGDALQHFKLSDGGKSLVPKNCLGHRLTLVGTSRDVCFSGPVLMLKTASSTSEQDFRVKFGSIVSVKCPNLAMAAIEDGTLIEMFEEFDDPSLIVVSFMNPGSQKVLSPTNVCGIPRDNGIITVSGDDLIIKLFDYGTVSQSQYFRVSRTSGQSVEIVSNSTCMLCDYLIRPCPVYNRAIVDSGMYGGQACTTGNNVELHNYLPEPNQPNHDIERRQWIIDPNGFIKLVGASSCANKVIGFQGNGAIGTLLKLQDKDNSDPNQRFTPVSDEIIFRPAKGNLTQLWEFYSSDPPYDFGVLPGFPGRVQNDGSLSSAADKELSKYAMHMCDRSMDLLLGSQMSLGTLRAIISDVQTNGPERMPGQCCFDTPTTNEAYLGLEFDPTIMSCQHPGLWHLGISEEACNNAGGKWFRSPCVTLKGCIDGRPKLFDPNSPQAGTCQDVLERLIVGFVSGRSQHANYTFDSSPSGCSNFCASLPDGSHQVGMMTEGGGDKCICMYNEGKVPDRVPDYAIQSPPKFSLVSNGKALGLSHEIADCTADEISIEVQDYEEGRPSQQLHLSSEGQLVSAKCPQRVFTALSNGMLKAMAPYYHLGDVEIQQQQWIYNASSGSIKNVKYPDLLISSINTDVSAFDSYFFSIVHQKTGLTLGVEGDNCADGQRIVLQTEVADSLSQKFKVGDNDKLISMKCPSHAFSVPHCTPGTALQLSVSTNGMNQWQFDDDGKIESIECEGMFIGAGEASRGVFRVDFHANTPVAPTFENDTSTNTSIYGRVAYNDRRVLSVGTEIILSSAAVQHHDLKWTQKHRRFKGLVGPYFFMNGNEFVIGIEEGECSAEMSLNAQAYDQNSPSQLFYLGNHGVIYSAECAGSAISMVGNCEEEKLIKLRSYEDNNRMKWEYQSNGLLRNVNCPISSENTVCNRLQGLQSRKVRIEWKGDNRIISLREVQVIDFEENNRALYRPVNQHPTSNAGYEPSNSVDGDDFTYTIAPASNDVFWEVDLGVNVLVKRVVVNPFDRALFNNLQITQIDENGRIVEAYRFNDLASTNSGQETTNGFVVRSVSSYRPKGFVHRDTRPSNSQAWQGGELSNMSLSQHPGPSPSKKGNLALQGNQLVEPTGCDCHGRCGQVLKNLTGVPVQIFPHPDDGNAPHGRYFTFNLTDLEGALDITIPETGSVAFFASQAHPDSPSEAVWAGVVEVWKNCNEEKSSCLPIGCTSDDTDPHLFQEGDLLYSPRPKYVKVSLSGDKRILSLAEVQVFALARVKDDGSSQPAGLVPVNIALESRGAIASGGTPYRNKYTASKAIDNITDSKSDGFTHSESTTNPWWMVELSKNTDYAAITEIVLWNRYGDGVEERLSGATVSLLDSNKQVIAKKTIGDSTGIQSFKLSFASNFPSITSLVKNMHTEMNMAVQGSTCGPTMIGGWGLTKIKANQKTTTSGTLFNFILRVEEDGNAWFEISSVICPDHLLAVEYCDSGSSVVVIPITAVPNMQVSICRSCLLWRINDGMIQSMKCPDMAIQTDSKFNYLQIHAADSSNPFQKWEIEQAQSPQWQQWQCPKSGAGSSRGTFNLSCGDDVVSVDGDQRATAGAPIRFALPGTPETSRTWQRQNTRLLSAGSSRSLWNQKWTIHFVDGDYDGNNTVGELLGPKDRGTSQDVDCYGPNPAFSATFEEFSKTIAITNENDAAQCQHARKQLAFDGDHPFDADVCDAFNKKMCGLEFTGGLEFTQVDYAMESLSKPPQFEMDEHEKAEYENVEYTEGTFEAPKYDEDDEFKPENIGIGDGTKWELAVDEESSHTSNPSKTGLNQVQDAWLALQLVQHAAERAYMFHTDTSKASCKIIPDTIPLGFGSLPNPAHYACCISVFVGMAWVSAVLTLSEIAAEVLFIKFEKATEGPDGEVYANNASRKTYRNLKNLDAYLKEALKKTNTNMMNQHSSMRKHLQTRHLQLETNIRSDIFDSQNDLGKGIVTAQNALGQAIVDSQNVNVKATIDARNANSGQRNAISTWLQETLCIIYKKLGGGCDKFIGPLPEDQTWIPMVLSWPEDQPNMMDRLEHLEAMGTGIHEAVAHIEKSLTVGMTYKGKGETMYGIESDFPKQKLDRMMEATEDANKVDAVEAKLDAMQYTMQDANNSAGKKMDDMENKVDAVEAKLDVMQYTMQDANNSAGKKMDDMENKVDAVEAKLDAMMDDMENKMQGQINEMEKKLDYMGNKIDDMIELISHVMQQNMK